MIRYDSLKYRIRRGAVYLLLIGIAGVVGAALFIGFEILWQEFGIWIRGEGV